MNGIPLKAKLNLSPALARAKEERTHRSHLIKKCNF
nr:MAG TPA: hypothetical protein [Caudoviricetes sp.]